MPAVSKAQYRYVRAIESGAVEADKKTRRWAQEVIRMQAGHPLKGLPERKKPAEPSGA